MPKRPTRPMSAPVMPSEDTDPGRRVCVSGHAALVQIEQLSRRLDDHAVVDDDRIASLREDISELKTDVKEVSNTVGDLRVDQAKMLSIVHNISTTLKEHHEVKHMRVLAEVETGKAEKIATIEDIADRKKMRRALWLKIGLAVIGAAGTALGMLIEHYR